MSAYIRTIMAAATISSAKLCALLLYDRIFWADPKFRILIKITGLLCVSWLFGASFATAFRCRPVRAGWDLRLAKTAKCFNVQNAFLAVEVPNCLLDITVVALPIIVINKLQLLSKQKFTVAVIFLLGGMSVNSVFTGLVLILTEAG